MNMLQQTEKRLEAGAPLILLDAILSSKGASLLGYCVMMLAMIVVILALLLTVTVPSAHANSRIKDIVTVEGVRDNMLVGYGLVVGLNGTGDRLNNSRFTQTSLVSFLERLGVQIRGEILNTANVAAVTVTADLPAFTRSGGRIDVRVSTLGDAGSIQGGVLLATPLLGADGEVYAVAQGSVSIEGFQATGGNSTTVLKGVPTNGYIPNGAIVEKEVTFKFNKMKRLNLGLRNADISTATRIATAINQNIDVGMATVLDPGTVAVSVPKKFDGRVSDMMAAVEQLEVTPDQTARIVVDEASGTIVMGENVRVDKVAIAQGSLVVQIRETPIISQPGAFAPDGDGVETVVATQTQVTVSEDASTQLGVLETGASLSDLVSGLNALGIGPRDLISILQTIKAAGAIQADIEAR